MSQARPPSPQDVVIHQGALGDWIVLWPLLRAMRQPAAVTTTSKARLAARFLGGVIPVSIESPAWSALHREGGELPDLPWLGEARRIISFVSDGHDAWAANVHRLAPRAQLAFLRSHPPASWSGHVTAYYQQQLREQGIELTCGRHDGPRPPAGPVVIHPGSGGAAKVWPLDRWRALIEALRQRGRAVRCVVGEVEAERFTPATLDDLGAELLPTLDELASALLQAGLYIGNDSGPGHLAAQLGVPTIALFGPSNPTHWSPLGPRVRVLAPPTPRAMDWLDVQTVLAAVDLPPVHPVPA